jgi:hypothetical protein
MPIGEPSLEGVSRVKIEEASPPICFLIETTVLRIVLVQNNHPPWKFWVLTYPENDVPPGSLYWKALDLGERELVIGVIKEIAADLKGVPKDVATNRPRNPVGDTLLHFLFCRKGLRRSTQGCDIGFILVENFCTHI